MRDRHHLDLTSALSEPEVKRPPLRGAELRRPPLEHGVRSRQRAQGLRNAPRRRGY